MFSRFMMFCAFVIVNKLHGSTNNPWNGISHLTGLDLSPEPAHYRNRVHSLYFILPIFHSMYLSTYLPKLALDTLKM